MKDEKVLYEKKLWATMKWKRFVSGAVGPFLYRTKRDAKFNSDPNELPVRVKVTVERL